MRPRIASDGGRVDKLQRRHAVTALEMPGQRTLIAKPGGGSGFGDGDPAAQMTTGRIEALVGQIDMRAGSNRALEQPDQLKNRQSDGNGKLFEQEPLAEPCL